jgi:hypothetical protein
MEIEVYYEDRDEVEFYIFTYELIWSELEIKLAPSGASFFLVES